MVGPPDEPRLLLSALPPDRAQRRLAVTVALSLVVALVAAAPFAARPTSGTESLLPAYSAAVLVNELITAALLIAMFSVQRSRGLLVLAVAYLFSGLMVVPWGLTFPGVFSATGLLDAGLQSTATLAAARRIGLPLLLLVYAVMKVQGVAAHNPSNPIRGTILATVATTLAVVCAFTLLAVWGNALLPRWMADTRNVSAAWHYVPPLAIALCLVAAAVLLWTRRLSLLDHWLLIVLLSSVIEIVLLAYLSGGSRFSIGWWAGRAYGLAASSVVLLVLLSETVQLYARLARSLLAERRTREARLAILEALSASIAHEVNQPLGSMVTNADAALRWLDKPSPDLEEARLALRRITNDGHRAGKVSESVRTMFKKQRQERVARDLNRLIDHVLKRSMANAELEHVTVQTAYDPNLPSITGQPVQLQQVVANLITNALDAMRPSRDRACRLTVTTGPGGPGSVMVSIEDSGEGLSGDIKQRIFEPFFTTKPEGMGMGLLFCRAIVERHGGRLWVDDGATQGAIFRFTLPADDEATATIKSEEGS
ncbi:MAG: MASE4 domain-containing protein [Kiloniellaceae bacterium]